MNLDLDQFRELESSISDRIYIQVEKWHLYLGDAGLAESLAIECKANLHQGASIAARKALEAVQVRMGGGKVKFPLARLVSSGQIFDLEEILDPYCR
ncbi:MULTISPECIES: DUF3181 family protein [Prochlorococcus]|uniref:DUF3181 family protein n=1 Tax=Prochlorococcus TaxID=1218 RepID=UPI000533A586|nr:MULTISPECIES: DUF3181 family protein [Prochlorococcus]KGG13104.1 hypothetical protein EV05_0780 [Prochlorococcus sp. MIT 0601]